MKETSRRRRGNGGHAVAAGMALAALGAFAVTAAGCGQRRSHGQASPSGAGAVTSATAPIALCVVHCDPVEPPRFEQNFALLEQLVAEADATGNKLSIHWTGSYAALAFHAGKAPIVQGWVKNGHGMGLHAHPEDTDTAGRWLPQTSWQTFPQDRVEATLAQATEEVNRLVGVEHNLVLDTLFPFYTSPARFPAQYTHFAWGNNGHGRPAPIVLPGRTLTAVFYRSLPGDPAVDPFQLPATRLLDELEASQVAYGPVLHPADFQGATRRELVTFFEQVRARGYAPRRVQDVSAPRGRDVDLRLTVEDRGPPSAPGQPLSASKEVEVRVENRGAEAVSGTTLTVYLPADYPELDQAQARPAPSALDLDRHVATYGGQSYAPGTTTTYLLTLRLAAQPVGHPISGVVDAYLDTEGAAVRWSFATLSGTPDQGWYLPFESFNPQGTPTTTATRVAAAPPTGARP